MSEYLYRQFGKEREVLAIHDKKTNRWGGTDVFSSFDPLQRSNVSFFYESRDGSIANEFEEALWVAPKTFDDLSLAPYPKIATNKLFSESKEALSTESWGFCIIKPDAKEQSMESRIREMMGEKALKIVAERPNLELNEKDLVGIWPAPPDADENNPSPWWTATIDYMLSSPVDILIAKGDNATTKLNEIKKDLRAEMYGLGYQTDESIPVEGRVRSVIHAADCNRELVGNALTFWSSASINRFVKESRIKQ